MRRTNDRSNKGNARHRPADIGINERGTFSDRGDEPSAPLLRVCYDRATKKVRLIAWFMGRSAGSFPEPRPVPGRPEPCLACSMLKDLDNFDNNLNNCEVPDQLPISGVARPATERRNALPVSSSSDRQPVGSDIMQSRRQPRTAGRKRPCLDAAAQAGHTDHRRVRFVGVGSHGHRTRSRGRSARRDGRRPRRKWYVALTSRFEWVVVRLDKHLIRRNSEVTGK